MSISEELKWIREFLEEKAARYNAPAFIQEDPISIPHSFHRKEDIEISAFLTATISWGRRDMIIRAAEQLMSLLPGGPYHFIMEAGEEEFENAGSFKYRTLQPEDTIYFLRSLRNIYRNHGGLEKVFTEAYLKNRSVKEALTGLREVFLELPGLQRTSKHVACVDKGSSGKRLNMFLRWIVRSDRQGVDFGLWKGISPADLFLPLDVHTGNVARKLGLLKRNANDWNAVEEVTGILRSFDPEDPVKYDFALFGLGVYEGF